MKPFFSNYMTAIEYTRRILCCWIYSFLKGKKFPVGLEVLSNLVEGLSLNTTFLVFMCILEALTTVRQTITRSTILKDSSSGRI